jgi:GntR family transcriptional regulator
MKMKGISENVIATDGRRVSAKKVCGMITDATSRGGTWSNLFSLVRIKQPATPNSSPQACWPRQAARLGVILAKTADPPPALAPQSTRSAGWLSLGFQSRAGAQPKGEARTVIPVLTGGKRSGQKKRKSRPHCLTASPVPVYHYGSTHERKSLMFFSIDPAGDVPIYEQIVRQVKLAIADGVLVGGQMVPSVRQMAAELAINPNTIARAYQELQSDQVLESLRGRGMVVRRDSIDRCTEARNSLVAEGVRRALSDALAGGMSPGDLRKLFEAELASQAERAAQAESQAAASAAQANPISGNGQSDPAA